MKNSYQEFNELNLSKPHPSVVLNMIRWKCIYKNLANWGRVTHICKLTIIGSDNGLSPDRRQAIILTNAGLLSTGPFWTYFSENLIKIQQFSLMKMHAKMSSAKWRPSFLGLNVLTISSIPSTWHAMPKFQYFVNKRLWLRHQVRRAHKDSHHHNAKQT